MTEAKTTAPIEWFKRTYILGALLVIFLVPWIFLGRNIGLTLSLIILICTISRETPFMDYMNVEIHSFIILIVGHTLGAFWGIFTAIFTYPLMFWLDLNLEFLPDPGENPFEDLIDTAMLIGLGLLGAIVSPGQLLFLGLAYITLANNILASVLKFFITPSSLIKQFAMSILNIFVNYILISNFTPLIISLLS